MLPIKNESCAHQRGSRYQQTGYQNEALNFHAFRRPTSRTQPRRTCDVNRKSGIPKALARENFRSSGKADGRPRRGWICRICSARFMAGSVDSCVSHAFGRAVRDCRLDTTKPDSFRPAPTGLKCLQRLARRCDLHSILFRNDCIWRTTSSCLCMKQK